ncbi:MAG: RhoGEF domain-containing protein [Bdellovibrionia bacterium]
MTKNSRALCAGSRRTGRFKLLFNWVAIVLTLFSTLPVTHAGTGNHQKIAAPSYPQPKPQANAEEYQAELQNLKDKQKALQRKAEEEERNTSRLLKRLDEKKAALEKIDNRIQESDADLANLANQRAGVNLRDRLREDLKLKKETLKEVGDLEKYVQQALDRSEANKSQLHVTNETLVEHSLRKPLVHPIHTVPVVEPVTVLPAPSANVSVGSSEPAVIPTPNKKRIPTPPLVPEIRTDGLKMKRIVNRAINVHRTMNLSYPKPRISTQITPETDPFADPVPAKPIQISSGGPFQGKNALKAFEQGFKSDDSDLRYGAIVEMSRLHGPNFGLVGLVFEKAMLSPHSEVREAAEALLADYPNPGREIIKANLLKSPHEEVRHIARTATPYSEMISWIKELPKYINETSSPAKCPDCTKDSSLNHGKTSPVHQSVSISPGLDSGIDVESPKQASSTQDSPNSASKDEKLIAKRFHQLEEILSSEKVFAEGLHFFIEDQNRGKTVIQEFINKKLIKKSELPLVNNLVDSLNKILANSKSLIAKLEPGFSGVKAEKNSILKMEKSVLEHFDPETLKKPYQEYFVNYKAFSQILARIENSKEGKEIIAERLPDLKNKLKSSQNSTNLIVTPSALSLMPIQRFLKYPILFKAITAKEDQKLDFEHFGELTHLSGKLSEVAVETNTLQKEAEEKPEKSKLRFWKK